VSVRTRGRAKARRRWLPQGDPRRGERASRTGVRGGALGVESVRSVSEGWCQQWHDPAAARQKASRPCLLGPHPSFELGAWSTWVTREANRRKSLFAPSASYRSAGTEPGGAHDDDVETSEVGIVRERLLQPYGAGGRHLRLTASPREGQARVAEHVARRTRRVLHTNSFELGATRRKTGPRGHRRPDGASNRNRPKRVRLTAHRLFASLRARTRWVC
jgi:hypothetical protein